MTFSNKPLSLTVVFCLFIALFSVFPKTSFAASATEINAEVRAQQYETMQKLYADSAPLLFMYETPFAVAVSNAVEGYVQTPLGNNIFEEATVSR